MNADEVSIRALAKRATHLAWEMRSEARQFRSAPSRRERPLADLAADRLSLFRSAPSRRERRARQADDARFLAVSIRALAKRATMRRDLQMSRICFDPRPREESDLGVAISLASDMPVSIRALAKRATRGDMIGTGFFGVSIRALAKRATGKPPPADTAVIVSIRALAKRATCRLHSRRLSLQVSIRALAKRATSSFGRLRSISPSFDPRPREESDSFVDNAIVGQGKEERRREPLPRTPAPPPFASEVKKYLYDIKQLWAARTRRENTARLRFAQRLRLRRHTISGPPKSTVALAPTCSTRRRQFDPR